MNTESDTPDTPVLQDTKYDPQFVRNMVEAALRIGLIFILLWLAFDIISLFISPLIWAAIIAVAAFPLVKWLEPKLGGKRGRTAALVSVFFVLLLAIPTWTVTESLLGSLKNLNQAIKTEQLTVPAPPAKVAELPVIGEKLYHQWSEANKDIETALSNAKPQLESLFGTVLKKIGGGVASVLLIIVAIAIAGGFMAYADSCQRVANQFFVRVGGAKPGGEWAALSVATVRSVLKGVVGVAIIQAVLVAIGLYAAGIPGAPIWSAIVLFFAIAQLPALIVLLPIIVWSFSAYDTTTAVIFSVWSLLAGASDNVLKPLLMGRGVDIPMPIILIGAIGGMASSGIFGLFAGAVILSIWYKLFTEWLNQQAVPDTPDSE
ncbi:MAG: AI-2E family transporter [Halioglobus sp.]